MPTSSTLAEALDEVDRVGGDDQLEDPVVPMTFQARSGPANWPEVLQVNSYVGTNYLLSTWANNSANMTQGGTSSHNLCSLLGRTGGACDAAEVV